MIRRALCISLSGMALLSAASAASAEPPPPATAASAAPSAPTAPAPSSAPPAPAAAPDNTAATPPPLAPYPYPDGYPHGYAQKVPPAPTLELRAPTQRYWYGWQTLVAFGVSGALMVTAPFVEGVTAPLSLGGFMLGGPIVHWANGNATKGFLSLGINIGATLVGGLTTGLACSSLCKGGPSLVVMASAAIGGGVGLLIANVVDVAVLSYGEHHPVFSDTAARRRPSLTWLPTFDAGKDRASVGLVGTF